MRKLVFLFCLILFVNLKIYSQEKDTLEIIIDYFEQMPIFPGGLDSFWCFLEGNFRYDILNDDNEPIKYFIKFVVDSTGAAKDFNIVATRPQSVKNSQIDSLKRYEIIRVFGLMPKWEPATQQGRKISCWYTIPIKTPYTDFKCNKFKNKGKIEFQPDSLAQFRLGPGKTNQDRINEYFYSKIVWPPYLDCSGRIVIKCIVDESGKLSDIKFIRRLCPEMDSEVLRAITQMPKWTPAIKNNLPVKSVVVITLPIKLQ